MLKRRTFIGATVGMMVTTLPLHRASVETRLPVEIFETFKKLTQNQHLDLVSGYVRTYLQKGDGAMWSGRMAQQYASVVPAALYLETTSFEEIRGAFELKNMVEAQNDGRLPVHLRRRIANALSVLPGYDPDHGYLQEDICLNHHGFMCGEFKRMISMVEAGYDGSTSDMARGLFKWRRA